MARSLFLENVLVDLVACNQPSIYCFSECCWQVHVELMLFSNFPNFTRQNHLFFNKIKTIVELVVLVGAYRVKVRDRKHVKLFIVDLFCLERLVIKVFLKARSGKKLGDGFEMLLIPGSMFLGLIRNFYVKGNQSITFLAVWKDLFLGIFFHFYCRSVVVRLYLPHLVYGTVHGRVTVVDCATLSTKLFFQDDS
jgi:hypothetical protein